MLIDTKECQYKKNFKKTNIMLKKVYVEVSYNGTIIYTSEGKTLLGVMLRLAAILTSFKSCSVYLTVKK